VLDPPRAGVGRKVIERVLAGSPRRLVYVSCNPTTLAADAALLAQGGLALRRVRPVDMFPQTHHIECVALLERG
jgi:23S rRNA (uracil1939-C5)-methyltransferase